MTPQELKLSILQLAIQGRLVEQRPEEGTGEELFKQIQTEKQALIKTGKIKKEKPLPEITEDEIPFDIPESWKWVRVGDYVQKVTDYVASGSFASLKENVKIYKEPNYAILVKTKDFQSNFTNDLTYTDKHGYEFLENSRLFGGELIMPNIGASIGKVFKVPYLDAKMTLAPNSVLIRFVSEEHLDWFSYYFASPIGFAQLKAISSSTAQAKFSKTEFKGLLIPIPPLAEQKRIVAKIEELLPLIDRYEQAWSKLEDFNKRFPVDMQKSILQMAIQGKLVPQVSEEGTGEKLFRSIQIERQAMIKAGKIKKGKSYPSIDENEIPFDIPETWIWARLQDLVYNRGQAVPSKTFCYIDIGSIDNKRQKLNPEDNVVEANKAPSRARKIVQMGDILYSTVRPYLHNMCIIDREFSFEPIASTGFAAMTCFEGINNKYLFYYLLSPSFDGYANDTENAKGVAYPAINDDRLYRAVIPVPPLAEQKRIVAKLEEILPLCERLK